MSDVFIRVPIQDAGRFGPGKARLLEHVAREGSIRAAASAMMLSYRRAWLMLEEIEKTFGEPVLERKTGGKSGGGTALTPLGHKIVKHYRALEKKAGRAVRTDLAALEKLRRMR